MSDNIKRNVFSVYFTLVATADDTQWRPPSTNKICPVINDASSDAKNATAWAMSAGSPTRPIGCFDFWISKNWRNFASIISISLSFQLFIKTGHGRDFFNLKSILIHYLLVFSFVLIRGVISSGYFTYDRTRTIEKQLICIHNKLVNWKNIDIIFILFIYTYFTAFTRTPNGASSVKDCIDMWI